jgi:hypothetical protein
MRWRRELTSRSLFTSGMTTARAKPSGRVSAGSEDKIRIRDLWVMSQPVAVSHCSARLTRAGQGLSLVYAVAPHPTQSWLLRFVLFTNPFTPSRTYANHRSASAHPPLADRSDDAKTRFTPRSIPTNRFLRWVRIAETTVNHQPSHFQASPEAKPSSISRSRTGLKRGRRGSNPRPTD